MRRALIQVRHGAALAALAAAAAVPASAAVCTATADALAFNVYDTLRSPDDDTAGTVTVTCTPGAGSPLTTAYTITIAGTGTGGDTVRSAAFGASRLRYQVYSDPGRTQVWGNGGAAPGVSGSVTSTTLALPAGRAHTVYARIPAFQRVPPGSYVGGLSVTVDY